MTRASWGSTTGDLGGLFSSLIDEQRRRIEESVQRDITRSKEQQNAEDNDMYDKWQNGIIDDQDWLQYVRQRVRDSKGDPTEHSEWMKTFREHRTAIQDANLESRYEAGTLSIHKLIAHYGDRMASTEQHSPEYRETQTRYFALVDQRDSYYIEDEANRILNRISRGQAGYGELRDFYQSMLGKVRRSSPLYRQIKDNLNSINQIGGSAAGGGGGGGGGSSSGRSGGGGGGDRDPYSTASRAVLKLWKSGNVFVPAGPDVVRSVLDAYNMNTRDDTTVWNALAEDSVVIEQLMDQATKNPNAKFLLTPWGDRIPNTLEARHMLMNQGLRGYDYRIALGNAQGRSVLGVLGARDSFVDTTFGEQNEAAADDYWSQIRQNFWERSELASQNPDPAQALLEYAEAGKVLERGAHRILGEPLVREGGLAQEQGRYTGKALPTGEGEAEPVGIVSTRYSKSKLFPEEQVTEDMQEELRYAIEISRFAKVAPTLSPEELQHEASLLFDQRPTSFWLTESDLGKIFGTDQITVDPTGFNTKPQVGTGLIGKAFANRGLIVADATVNRGQINDTGVDAYRYVGVPGSASPIAVPSESINSILGTTDYQDGSTMGGWEKIGGMTRWVIRPLEDIEPPQWFFNEKGEALKAEDFEKWGRDFNKIAEEGYASKPVQALAGWKKITDGDGRMWYRDPADGHLYADRPPFQTSVFGPVFNYSQFVGDNGEIDMEAYRVAASTGRGYIAFFTSDVSAMRAQQLTEELVDTPDQDLLNLEFFHQRDDKNFVQPTPLSPDDIVGMFWTPSARSVDENPITGTDYMSVKSDRLRRDTEHEFALERAEQRRKAEVQGWIEQRIGNAKQQAIFKGMSGMSDTDLASAAGKDIESAKSLAGIRIGAQLRESKIRQQRDLIAPEIAAPPTPRPIRPVPIKPPERRRPPTINPPRRRGGGGVIVPNYEDSGKVRNIPF